MSLGNRPITKPGLALFQSGLLYHPTSLARLIVNMERTPEGTLETFAGTTAFDPKAASLPGPAYGIAHVETFDGANQVTVVRANTRLVRHAGWSRSWEDLATGLTYDPNQPFPDVCLAINGLVVWSNGIDRPLVVDCRTDGRLCIPLGFSQAPAAPTALGPSPGAYDAASGGSGGEAGVGAGVYAPNMLGYSVPGNIGTVSTYNGEDGALLDSAHFYAVQWEDPLGNLSPLSALSNAVTIAAQSCGYLAPASGDYVRKNKLDMLLRGFAVRGVETGESHVKAIHLYRTTDTLHTDGALHLRARIEGRWKFTYPDGMSDGALLAGDVPVQVVPVPTFRVACEYQGRLVIGNLGGGNSAMVRWSQPGTIGTFEEDAWVIPDAGGAQITGAMAYQDACLLWTDNSLFKLTIGADGQASLIPLAHGVGCVAPNTIRVLPDGRLLWLGRTSVYSFDGNSVTDIGIDIQVSLRAINTSKAGRAVAAVDPNKGIYILAFPAGDSSDRYNDTLRGFDYRINGWHSYDLGGLYPFSMCVCPGRPGHLLIGTISNVRVWGHPDIVGESLTSKYQTVLLRMDEQGLQTFRVREILIGFIETDSAADDPSAVIRVWNTVRKTGATAGADNYIDFPMELVAQDFLDTWRLGNATLNGLVPTNTGAYYRDPAMTWRRVGVNLTTTTGLMFEISTQLSRRMHLHAIAIIAEAVGNEASRLPGATR